MKRAGLHSVATWLLVVLVDFVLCAIVQGDNFCSELMCVTAFVNSSMVTYQLTALNQLGWMATGFGTQMTDAKMVIMWPNMDGTVTLSQRTATGLVEPNPDPNPPRIASTFLPLTTFAPTTQQLSFTVPKDATVVQEAVWALSFANPMSNDPDANLIIHVDAGNFTLNLTNMIDTDDLPISQTSSESSTGSAVPSSETQPNVPFAPFEKMIIVHGVFTVAGFLVILPFGAIFARWGRTFTDNWFYYHWTTQVILSIPIIVVGWALGPLAVATQDVAHANDAHKIFGLIMLILYLAQLCLGSYMHFKKPAYPKRHPWRNVAHVVLGITLIALSFYEVRNGFQIEWVVATGRSINLNVFSNVWIAWIICVSITYFSGFALVKRQLAHERDLPPPYFPGPGNTEQESTAQGMRRLLGLDAVDDGTHDMFSEEHPNTTRRESQTLSANNVEMREVRLGPLSVANSSSST